MAEAVKAERMPRPALVGAMALVLFTLGATGLFRLGGQTPLGPEESAAIQTRLLRFVDRPQGGVGVFDASSGESLLVIVPGEDGFVRGVLRGLARDRRSRDIGAEPPFRLARLSDGRLLLEDVATGRRIDLAAFGPTNAGAFARFLAKEGTRT
jgi:putative photosynthetic complex assembly protein